MAPKKHSSSIVFDGVFSFPDHLNPDKKDCKKSTIFFVLTFSHKNLLNIDVTEMTLSAYLLLGIVVDLYHKFLRGSLISLFHDVWSGGQLCDMYRVSGQ